MSAEHFGSRSRPSESRFVSKLLTVCYQQTTKSPQQGKKLLGWFLRNVLHQQLIFQKKKRINPCLCYGLSFLIIGSRAQKETLRVSFLK